jgi:hypothetical protein
MPEFNPLDYSLWTMDPIFFGADSAWLTHMPFAFALVEMTRPSTFVELGTHFGDSFCAFCQGVAAARLPTRCFAVDTWQGDSQAGFYKGDQIYQTLQGYLNQQYAGFSELLRMEFDQAVSRFGDGTVDLLHIDGCHTYEAVRHDFQSWLGKLSPAGVVLFHDVASRKPGFGVWQFWEEIAGKYPSFAFEHGHGLGILAVGNAVPERLMQFLEQANQQPQRVRDFFSWRGGQVQTIRLMGTLFHLGRAGQNLVNQWLRETGRQPDPSWTDPNGVMADPVNAFSQIFEQMRQAMVENLHLRKANPGG